MGYLVIHRRLRDSVTEDGLLALAADDVDRANGATRDVVNRIPIAAYTVNMTDWLD